MHPSPAIVNLPRKHHSKPIETPSYRLHAPRLQMQDPRSYDALYGYGEFLVSNRLYLERLPSSVHETDIMDLLRSCHPILVQLEHNVDHSNGYVEFASKEQADRAYTLFNGAKIGNQIRFQPKIAPPGYNDPEATAGLLQIENLPENTKDHTLYDIFRRFGPMNVCKIIVDDGAVFRGNALVQYFREEAADMAVTVMASFNDKIRK
ncbi:hypothetical protein EC973_002264 [Apophysomyces ossiformis]|uniref:RRM domain-containing protein n=1 Tax=Apophysomyces ossiformis TaxID=679940 RepID=A0A8H7BWF1_9FUNG|nr:hypothetical protein EC973_002264 [Apophysomyces ossiformis]